jgi:hypothetical protein
MILDSLLQFTGAPSGGITASDGRSDVPTTGSQTSSNIIDLGLTGIPLSASGGGARDIGIGDDPALKFMVLVTVGFTGGTSLQVNVQGAPDNGSGAAGSFTAMVWGPVVALAQLVPGVRLLDVDMPRPAPGQAIPRFLQLGFVSVGTFTGGLQRVQGYLVLDRVDQVSQAAAISGGYPAGITVAN